MHANMSTYEQAQAHAARASRDLGSELLEAAESYTRVSLLGANLGALEDQIAEFLAGMCALRQTVPQDQYLGLWINIVNMYLNMTQGIFAVPAYFILVGTCTLVGFLLNS